MKEIYCGNNKLDTDVLSGKKVIGTRYSCMQKGIGYGLQLPYDYKYNQKYTPIDNINLYCGNKNILPSNYDFFGTLPFCIQKGIGIGKKIKAEQTLKKKRKSKNKSPKRKSKNKRKNKSPKRKSKKKK